MAHTIFHFFIKNGGQVSNWQALVWLMARDLKKSDVLKTSDF